VPPCQRCGCELELATLINGFGERPTTYVFRCPQCKRQAPYYRNEDGELATVVRPCRFTASLALPDATA
jgi:hypothetical protein